MFWRAVGVNVIDRREGIVGSGGVTVGGGVGVGCDGFFRCS